MVCSSYGNPNLMRVRGVQVKSLIEVSELERASDGLHTLKQALHPEDVVVLAREVLDRVAAHVGPVILESQPLAVEIENLTQALLSPDAGSIAEAAARLTERGIPLQRIYTAYLAGAARRLGILWEEDKVSFMDVTLASSRIFGIVTRMRDLRPVPRVTHRQCVAVAPVPGEAHTLGAQMAADLLRDAGWDVVLLLESDHDKLIAALGEVDCLLVAISTSSNLHLAALARLVVALRVSLPALKIMISGRVVDQERELIELMGPDSIANDITLARDELKRLEPKIS